MSTQAINKPATSRQLEYIERLQKEIGQDRIEVRDKISSFEASKLISELITKTPRNGSLNGKANNAKINEPRLGMAMKECFKVWKNNGWDIYSQHKGAFIMGAINTYRLFTEIAERLARNTDEKKVMGDVANIALFMNYFPAFTKSL